MSGACQPSDCNHTNSTPGSPASQLTLKILRFVSLSVSIIHEPIPYTIQSISTPCLPQECIYSIGLFLSRTLINTIIKIMFDVIDEPVSSKELHQNWVKGGWSITLKLAPIKKPYSLFYFFLYVFSHLSFSPHFLCFSFLYISKHSRF